MRLASSSGYLGTNGEVFREYTELFEFEHRDIRLEVVETVNQGRYWFGTAVEDETDPLAALKEAMTSPTPPDIVMLEFGHLKELINENLLLSLDEMVLKEKDLQLDKIVPAVVDGLRKPGNGTLFALAPMFSTSAVIYNKQLFLDQGVEFPKDRMTWQDLFDLARRVTVQDDQNPVYGFSFDYYQGGLADVYYTMNSFISDYVQPLGLNWIDADTLQMTVNTPAWQEVWATFAELYRDKIIPQGQDRSSPRAGPFDWDLFLSGRAAMVIVPFNYLHRVIEANEEAERLDNHEPIEWDVVTLPTHPEAPGIGSNVLYQGIFAINANAENIDDAWEFIKFIMSEDYARIKSRSAYYMLAHQEYNQPINGVEYNHDAFLQLLPPDDAFHEMELSRKLPDYWSVRSIGQQKMYDVLMNGKDIGLALQEWETEGQMMIRQLLEQQGNGSDAGKMPAPLPADRRIILKFQPEPDS